jgi:3'-phosphoadenosine 5'-phosphosulfate (PAPS) 3'-phosphatase
VAEAGGRITDAFGDPLRWNQPFPKSKGVLAGAPKSWERVREIISSVGMSDRMDEVTGR